MRKNTIISDTCRGLSFQTITFLLSIILVGTRLFSTRYRTNISRYDVGDIDPQLCTHLIYAFAQIDITTKLLTASEAWVEEGVNGKFSQFNNLKTANPRLKTLISIGGQNENKLSFQAVAQTDEALLNFSRTTVTFLRDRGFDGLDIDWEYPDADSRVMFVKLLQSLRAAFDGDTSSPRLLLTVAGAAGKWNIDPGYDVAEMARYVDFLNVMTYDYTDKYAQVAAFNSPLYSRGDPRFNPTLSTNWTVHYWNSLGMPFSKIVVGITGVGRWLVLQNESNSVPGSAVTGEVRKGQYYGLDAGLAYPEICDVLNKTSTTRTFDVEQKNPYLVYGDNWVGYEDAQSIGIKLEWMKGLGVAGIMFWALDQDDFTGQLCGQGKYPLLNFIKLKTRRGTTTTQPTTVTSSSTPPTTTGTSSSTPATTTGTSSSTTPPPTGTSSSAPPTTTGTSSSAPPTTTTGTSSSAPPTSSNPPTTQVSTETTTEITNLLSTTPNGSPSSLQSGPGSLVYKLLTLLLSFYCWFRVTFY